MKLKTLFSDMFRADGTLRENLRGGGYFNGTLFVKNLTRFWPLWAMSSFFGSLLPLGLISNHMHFKNTMNPLEVTEMYYTGVRMAPVIMLGYCILCAMCVWGYLYNSRSVGLMHTLPIRREGLFLTNFLSGLVMVAIPCVVTAVFSILFSLLVGGFELRGLVVTILAVAGEGFFYFASATAAAFLTGNIFALPVLYFGFHFLAPALDTAISIFSSCMIFGLSNRNYSGIVEFLSPTMYLTQRVYTETQYDMTSIERDGRMVQSRVLSSITLENWHLILIYALVGVGLLGIAWMFYQRRRSESAGDVIAFGWGKPVFRYGIAALTAISGGQLLYLIFFEGLDNGRYRLLPLIFCMTLAGLIGYYAASMLLAKTLRVFQGSWRGAVVTFAGCAVLCSALYFDMFGVAARIPDNSRVDSVALQVAGNSYRFVPGQDDALLTQLHELHRAIVDDQAYIRNAMAYGWGSMEMDLTSNDGADDIITASTGVSIQYNLKNGLYVSRYYVLPLTKSRMETPGNYESLLDTFVNSPEMKQRRLHIGDSDYTRESGYLYLERRNQEYTFSTRELTQLFAALEQDIADGTWGTYDWFANENQRYAMNMQVTFATHEDNNRYYDYVNVRIRPGMTHTVETLRNMGYVTDYDLVTYEEWDKIREEDGDEEIIYHGHSDDWYDDEQWDGFDESEDVSRTLPAGVTP